MPLKHSSHGALGRRWTDSNDVTTVSTWCAVITPPELTMEGQAKVNKPVHSALHFNKCNKLMDAAVSHISNRSIFSVMNTKSQ